MVARQLNAKEFAGDVRAGLDDIGLMNKYELSPSQLKKAFEKLLNAGLITESDVAGRSGQRISSPVSSDQLTKFTTTMPDPETQPGTFQQKVAGYFYAEAAEVEQKKRNKKQLIIYTAIGLAVIPFLFAAIGYGKQIMLIYTVGTALFIFFYYLVVVYHCFQQSTVWGILSLCFSPAAILFVILNWNTVFEGKFLPRLWLALMVPLTLLSFATKYAHS
jgi:hypothetical protein